MIWLVATWVALVALWGRMEPGPPGGTLRGVARAVRGRRQDRVQHPFDWSKE